MIKNEQIPILLLKTIPSFKYIYSEEVKNFEHSSWWFLDDGKMNYYAFIASFNIHFLELFEKTQTDGDIFNFFELLERMLMEGDDEVKNTISIGLIENLQGLALQRNIPLDSFLSYLYPESLNTWNYFINFWKNKNK